MFNLDSWQEIYATIKKNKLRTFLTGFSVAWGIFMLIILLGAGKGLEKGIRQQFASSATNAIWIWTGRTSEAHDGYQAGRRIQFHTDDYEKVRATEPGREYVASRFHLGTNRVNYKDKHSAFDIVTTYPDYKQIEKIEILTGRFVNILDIENLEKVAVIGAGVVDFLFDETEKDEVLGKYIKVNDVPFKVVGTFTDEDGRDDNNKKVYIPITTAQKVFSTSNRVHNIVVTVKNPTVEKSKAMQNRIKHQMARKHNFKVTDPSAIYMWSAVEELKNVLDMMRGIRIFIWIIGVGTIIAGIVGVSNIMAIVVKERTKEIGIRKAIGAKPLGVIALILQESILITTVAGYIGLVVGVGLLELISPFIATDFFREPSADIGVAIRATIVLVVAGTIAGFIPARRAAAIKPVVALRDE